MTCEVVPFLLSREGLQEVTSGISELCHCLRGTGEVLVDCRVNTRGEFQKRTALIIFCGEKIQLL